jgi:hypothetical protein
MEKKQQELNGLLRHGAGDSYEEMKLTMGPWRRMTVKLGQTPSVIFGRSSRY